MKPLAIAAAVALVSALTLLAAAPKADKPASIYPVTYAAADLPVWRTNLKDTQFAPEILIAHLRATIDPNSWSSGAEITADDQHAALIISQTAANHKAITATLRGFRLADGREVEECRRP